jgi:hypothetical protein
MADALQRVGGIPIGFQIIPLVVLLGAVWLFPESPRWLFKAGSDEESRYVLGDCEEAPGTIRYEQKPGFGTSRL